MAAITEEKEDHDHLHYHGVDKAEQHISVDDALTIFLGGIKTTKPEKIKLSDATNRVLISDIVSPQDLPRLARSSRDGYAIVVPENGETTISRDFKVIGEIRIGRISSLVVNPGEAARVATGSFIPRGANAVVMREYSNAGAGTLRISKSPKIGENIVSPGEDLKRDEPLFGAGSKLQPHNIALLAMLGVKQIRVSSKPRIAIFSTGDELKNLESPVSKDSGATFDSNRPFLASAISELGGIPVDLGIAHDNFKQIRAKMIQGLKSEGLILSAGSSVGERDYVTKAAESIKGLRLLIHGVAMRPSSPTGLAVCRGKPVIFLPGFPTSAIVSFYVFGRPAVLKLSGASETGVFTFRAVLDEDYDGKPGLTHFVRVQLRREGELLKAKIVRPTEAQYSSWLKDANGIAIIGRDGKTVVRRGEEVSVFSISNN